MSYTVDGRFSSFTEASGTISLSYNQPDCVGSLPLNWTARKVVCGDGIIEWSETCDDGNRAPEDGCSELCQLSPVLEAEPNDEGAGTLGTAEDDILIAGAIDPGTDADVFAFRNPYAGLAAVAFETHGETIGTCGVDTLIDVVTEEGVILARDDDGSRALHCSFITYAIPAGQTVYVRVTSASKEPIPSYLLHARYPHS